MMECHFCAQYLYLNNGSIDWSVTDVDCHEPEGHYYIYYNTAAPQNLLASLSSFFCFSSIVQSHCSSQQVHVNTFILTMKTIWFNCKWHKCSQSLWPHQPHLQQQHAQSSDQQVLYITYCTKGYTVWAQWNIEQKSHISWVGGEQKRDERWVNMGIWAQNYSKW